MKIMRGAPLLAALSLSAFYAGAVRAQDSSDFVVKIHVQDSIAHVVDRQSADQARFAIVSRDGRAALLLMDTTIVAQMTDRGMARMDMKEATDTIKSGGQTVRTNGDWRACPAVRSWHRVSPARSGRCKVCRWTPSAAASERRRSLPRCANRQRPAHGEFQCGGRASVRGESEDSEGATRTLIRGSNPGAKSSSFWCGYSAARRSVRFGKSRRANGRGAGSTARWRISAGVA